MTVHRVVQEIVRSNLAEAERDAWLLGSLTSLSAADPGDPSDVRTWPRWDPLQPHLLIVTEYGVAAGIAEPTSELMDQLGQLFFSKALHAQAEPLFRTALA